MVVTTLSGSITAYNARWPIPDTKDGSRPDSSDLWVEYTMGRRERREAEQAVAGPVLQAFLGSLGTE